MNRTLIFLFTVIGIVAFSCKNNQPQELSEQQKLVKEISDFEADLFTDIEPNRDKALEMIDKYLNYVENYPQDSLCPEYLFKASEIAMNFSQPHNSIRYLTQIETDYPNYQKYPTVIFMKGFVYDNFIGDYEKAKIFYTKYVEEYPEHTFVKDANAALMFLGISDEQLVDIFEDINKYN